MHEISEADQAAVLRSRTHADVDDLHAQLILPIAEAEEVVPHISDFPEARAARGGRRVAGERINAYARAHALEGMAECRVAAYLAAVRDRKRAERMRELVNLRTELSELDAV